MTVNRSLLPDAVHRHGEGVRRGVRRHGRVDRRDLVTVMQGGGGRCARRDRGDDTGSGRVHPEAGRRHGRAAESTVGVA
jgi:hypothetical protein